MKVEVLRGQDEIGLFIFFACPKKTNQKKRHPVSFVPPQAGYPALLDAAGALQTRCAQTVQIPFRQPLRCSAACQWDFSFSLPHLSCRASQAGAGKDAKTV